MYVYISLSSSPKNPANWVLSVVLLHGFALSFHWPNIDVTTKLSKSAECK